MIFLHKIAANIVVEPYEAVIEKGIKLVEAVKGSSFFSGVSKIVVEHNMDHHYGRVFSNDPNTIYISGPRIKSEFGADPVEQIYQIASTLIHEMAHLKDKMEHGEGPSEAAEAQFLSEVKTKLEAEPDFLKKFAGNKTTQLFKQAKPEPSGIFDDEGQIIVTTAARIVFRKNNSAWAKVPNKILNPFIAEAYKSLPIAKIFKDKNGSDKGEIRGDKSNSMIGIVRGKTIAIVHVKGQFGIPNPPEREELQKAAGRNTALEAERGWLSEHFFDLFAGQFALDEESEKRLRDYLAKDNQTSKLAKMNNHQLSEFAASFMAENFNKGTLRDPAHMLDGSGLLNFPNSFPKPEY